MQLRAGSPKASALIWRWRGTPAEAATGPSAASVRVRGTLQALGGAAFGGLSLAFWSKGVALVAFALSGLVLFSALVSPGGLYALLRRLFDATGRVIGRITTWIVMVPIFYLFLLPFGKLARHGHRDRLHRRFEPDAATYWEPHRVMRTSSPERQY